MQGDLAAPAQPPRRGVSIGVAGQESGLEEHHGGVPDCGRAAEQRQHHPGEHRLDPEQEQRAQQQGGGEQRQDAGTGAWTEADREGRLVNFAATARHGLPGSHR